MEAHLTACPPSASILHWRPLAPITTDRCRGTFGSWPVVTDYEKTPGQRTPGHRLQTIEHTHYTAVVTPAAGPPPTTPPPRSSGSQLAERPGQSCPYSPPGQPRLPVLPPVG